MSRVQTPEVDNNSSSSKTEFEDFIIAKDHPCLMAQTVFSMDKVDFHEYDNFGSGKLQKQF